nr:EOG090X0E6P [Triops cancriformis]
MVKLYSLAVLNRVQSPSTAAILLKAAYDLQSFGFFQRSSVQEFMGFTARIVTERTSPANRQSVKQGEYMVHVYVRADGLTGVLISDHEYPHRVAHTLLMKVLDEFVSKVPTWSSYTNEAATADVIFTALDGYLAKYQNPREADALTKIQDELDETKIILHNTIEAVLERGEKLDDLVSKSQGLSDASKMFYKTARKTNSCCSFVRIEFADIFFAEANTLTDIHTACTKHYHYELGELEATVYRLALWTNNMGNLVNHFAFAAK